MGTILLASVIAGLSVFGVLVSLFYGSLVERSKLILKYKKISQNHRKAAVGKRSQVTRLEAFQKVIKQSRKNSDKRTTKIIRLAYNIFSFDILVASFIISSLGSLSLYIVFGSSLFITGVSYVTLIVAISLILERRKVRKNSRKLVSQLPNAVDLCVRSLEAGLSITTAFSVCAEELQEPIRSEFKIMRDDMKSGLGIEEAVMRFNQRRTETAVTYFAPLIALQNRSGGGLSNGLKNLSRVLRENQRLYVRLLALTSEPKTSMRVLIAIPIIFGFVSTMINPENMRKFFETDLGLIYFFGLVGWAGIGVFIMNAMTDIDDV